MTTRRIKRIYTGGPSNVAKSALINEDALEIAPPPVWPMTEYRTTERGYKWCTVWPNGWCQQGGKDLILAEGARQIDFIRAFRDSNIVANVTAAYHENALAIIMMISSYTASQLFVEDSEVHFADGMGDDLRANKPFLWTAMGMVNL